MKIFWKIMLVLFLCVCCLSAGFYFGATYKGPLHFGAPSITSEILSESFKTAGELVTVTYSYTGLGNFTNSLMFKDWTIPLTTKSFIVTYDGIIRAGVDLSKVDFEVEDYVITVKIPDAYIISHDIDENSVQVYDQKKNIFNPITVEDVAGFEAEQKELNEKTALEKGLLHEAERNARTSITELLMKLDAFEDYEVVFK